MYVHKQMLSRGCRNITLHNFKDNTFFAFFLAVKGCLKYSNHNKYFFPSHGRLNICARCCEICDVGSQRVNFPNSAKFSFLLSP